MIFIPLTEKQRLFCRCYAALRSPAEAAVRAGYAKSAAQQTALRLLELPEARALIDRFSQQDSLRQTIRAGYERLAFGTASDAVRLVLGDSASLPDLDTLDLFCVSELRRAKDGGLDVKLADRLAALDRLTSLSRQEESDAASTFYAALERSARALEDTRPEDAPPPAPPRPPGRARAREEENFTGHRAPKEETG